MLPHTPTFSQRAKVVLSTTMMGVLAATSAPAAVAADNDQGGPIQENRRDRQPIRTCNEDEVNFLYGRDGDNIKRSKGNNSLLSTLGKKMGKHGDAWMTDGTEENESALRIYDYFTQKIGTSGAFAVAAVTNSYFETGGTMDPTISEGGGHFEKNSKEPDHGGPGGGIFQFTPYSKYADSKFFDDGGWEIEPEIDYLWDSEFRSGGVMAFMSQVPARSGGKYSGFPHMVKRKGDKVVLDKNAWLTTSDPIEATATFTLAYERPAEFDEERAHMAAVAQEYFNKDHYEGDAEKLEKALGKSDDTSRGNGARNSAANGASPKGSKDRLFLFLSPCIDPDSGELIRDFADAIAFRDRTCTSTGSGGKGRTFNGSDKEGMEGDDMYINGVAIRNWDHLRPKTQKGARMIAEEFGDDLTEIGGWRPVDEYPYHPGGYALDVMTEDKELGDKINEFAWDHADELNLYDSIWQQTYFPNGVDSGDPMKDRGGRTANHYDHVHLTIDYADGPAGGSGGGSGSGKSSGRGKSDGKGCSSAGSKGKSNSSISADGVAIPAEGIYSSGYGQRWGELHDGLDIANDIGTPIYAVMDGTVKEAGPASGYGQWVVIDHGDGVVTEYGHVSSYSVKSGDKVQAGDEIAKMGAEGNVTGPHLHLRLYEDGQTGQGGGVDPLPFFQDNGCGSFPSEEGGQVTLDMCDGGGGKDKKDKKDKDKK